MLSKKIVKVTWTIVLASMLTNTMGCGGDDGEPGTEVMSWGEAFDIQPTVCHALEDVETRATSQGDYIVAWKQEGPEANITLHATACTNDRCANISETANSGDDVIEESAISVHKNGTVFALYSTYQSMEEPYKIMALVYDAKTSGWSSPLQLNDDENSLNSGGAPDVFVRTYGQGRAMVLWSKKYTRTFDGTAWSTKVNQYSNKLLGSVKQVLINDQGNGVVVIKDSVKYHTVAIENGVPAGDKQTIGDRSIDDCRVAVDKNANSIMVCEQDDLLLYATQDKGSAWSDFQQIDGVVGAKSQFDLSFDGEGHAVLVLHSDPETDGNRRVFSAHYSTDEKWSSLTELFSGSPIDDIKVFSNQVGTIVAIWDTSFSSSAGTSYSLYSARWSGDSGEWTPQETITGESRGVDRTNIAVNEDGGALAVWRAGKKGAERLQGLLLD